MSTSPELQELLDFFRISAQDLAALADLRAHFEAAADRLIAQFYQHLLEFPDTERLLKDPERRMRLLGAQREYLLSLCDPNIDDDYLERRARIGTVHEHVGLETRWYLGGYALYFSLLYPVVHEALGHDSEALTRATSALTKRLYLDTEIAMRQYIDRREQDLRRLNQQLERAGRALSREVDETTQSLHQTQQRARVAEELASVATLITGLAHEIGTPMGVIRGHAEALEGAVEGERARWRLDMILSQIDRITSIIQSLLNIARPKENLVQPLDLEDIVNTSLAFLTEKIKRRSVEVEKHVGKVPAVSGDPEKMQQVFLNLFINAIDAMPGGGTLRVSIDSETKGDDAPRATIRVADTGSGITAKQLECVFDPFFTTKEAGHGSGLGLVVVQGIVNDHDGTIDAYSEVGEGTEFVIRLPSRGDVG